MNEHPRYARWPIALGWQRHSSTKRLDRHGWWTPSGYGQTIHIGALKIFLGDVGYFERRNHRAGALIAAAAALGGLIVLTLFVIGVSA